MKKIILIILSTSLFATVTNDAILTIDSDVNVTVNGDLINTGEIYNDGTLIISGGLYIGDNGLLVNTGTADYNQFGDANGDYNINILDVIIIVDMILNNYNGGDVPSDDVLLASDMNEDDVIDVSDVVLLINDIMDILIN